MVWNLFNVWKASSFDSIVAEVVEEVNISFRHCLESNDSVIYYYCKLAKKYFFTECMYILF